MNILLIPRGYDRERSLALIIRELDSEESETHIKSPERLIRRHRGGRPKKR